MKNDNKLTMLEEYYDTETKTLTIPCDIDEELTDLPLNVQIIIFESDHYCEEGIEDCEICGGYFTSKFNQRVDNLPNTLTQLTFSHRFNKSVDNLPNNLTHLTFGDDFNQLVDNLPTKLTNLTFGYYFNQSVDNLPTKLTNLTFGFHFNQKVDNLPKSLTHLTFGDSFNNSVDNLPTKLTNLTFGYSFNNSVDNLPTKLTNLTFGYNFNQLVDNLPNTIKELSYWSKSKLNIPNNVEYLNINFYYKQDENANFYYLDAHNEVIDNPPSNIKKITTNTLEKPHYLKKIPFGCKLVNYLGNEIIL
jgi:hypothetical protein